MTDQGFPIIEYRSGQSPHAWGLMHGESYRQGIHELYEIRLNLMRERNPRLSATHITRLANEQWMKTANFDADLTAELEGIGRGANLSAEQLVVLNNYTDFRDIQLPDEGCSVVFVNRTTGPIAGQTWDMHGSAKNYVCCLRIPATAGRPAAVAFSLVGCVGLMGYTSLGTMVGVNNINTDGAVPGVIWPVLVRKLLVQPSHRLMTQALLAATVTSGHAYLLASREGAEMWEILPELNEQVGGLTADQTGVLFHTNHCLGSRAKARELPTSLTSTTHIRYELLQRKVDGIDTFADVEHLLNDHENYPQSICSNFQANSQDPSITCGGAVGHLSSGQVVMWRGDAKYDQNFRKHQFNISVTALGQSMEPTIEGN